MWYRYKIFNLLDEEAKELVNETFDVVLEGIGRKKVDFFKGFNSVLQYEGNFIPVNFQGQNPYRKDGHGVYVDDNYDVHLEIYEEEE